MRLVIASAGVLADPFADLASPPADESEGGTGSSGGSEGASVISTRKR